MLSKHFKTAIVLLSAVLILFISACEEKDSSSTSSDKSTTEDTNAAQEEVALINNITLSKARGTVREQVEFTVDELTPNAPVQLLWTVVDGKYVIEDLYTVVGPEFTEEETVLVEGTSDADGVWKGSFDVPEGFGGDYTVYVAQDGKKIGQTLFTVDPTFTMEPTSGPVGTEVTIKVEGLGWSTYSRNWQLTYDNKYTGLLTAISTNGTAEAKIRAAGPSGDHVIRLRTGYLGSPYVNYLQSPFPDKPAPEFTFTVTDEKPVMENYVENKPVAADGGLEMPELQNKDGVEVSLDKEEGTVGEPVVLTANGLPENKDVEIVWNTMKGSRVSGLGFAEEHSVLSTVKTDENGSIVYDFEVPEDLGGIPHRIDLKIGDEVYGQEYLSILPSIVEVTPSSGPVGTHIQVKITGGGWTEFDNAYYITYDNAYSGYVCAFNSQGTLIFDVVATGEPGYHVIDMYPGIYKQQVKDSDMTLIPQLTYSTDHPGSAIPALRMGFEITE